MALLARLPVCAVRPDLCRNRRSALCRLLIVAGAFVMGAVHYSDKLWQRSPSYRCPSSTSWKASPLAFSHTAEWADKTRLTKDDTLPLLADFAVDVGSEQGATELKAAGCGSYIADFGVIDAPGLGEVRARAGIRYSRLYPRGALELGIRKELRTDDERGYELCMGAQSAGDDRRLDVVSELSVRKLFRGARAFYSFRWGCGRPFESQEGPTWNEMGSTLGVTQERMPPHEAGRLTVGWRTGLFDHGLEGVAPPSRDRKAPRKKFPVLDSTPFAEYGVDLPTPGDTEAHVSATVLPEHGAIEYGLRVKASKDTTGGAAGFFAVVDQDMSNLRHARLRLGASYMRG